LSANAPAPRSAAIAPPRRHAVIGLLGCDHGIDQPNTCADKNYRGYQQKNIRRPAVALVVIFG
jgi:hypothetical protein